MTGSIILAAGSGTRFGKDKTKLKLFGKDLITHFAEKLSGIKEISYLVFVVKEKDVKLTLKKLNKLKINKNFFVIFGGVTRSESIMNSLNFIKINMPQTKNVLINNIVNPVFENKDIKKLYKEIFKKNTSGAILGYPITDSIGYLSHNGYSRIERSNLWSFQTPHLYNFKILYNCFTKFMKKPIEGYDAAEICIMMGEKISIVEGSRLNIKITYKEDLKYIKL